MMAVAIWGTKANGGAYAAIAALTNILTACLSLIVYEGLFADSTRGTGPFNIQSSSGSSDAYSHLSAVVSPDHYIHLRAQEAELERRTGKPANSSLEPNDSNDKIAA